jgi:hypothetical protein
VSELSRNSVTLSWSPPSSDGGAAISAYIIERCEKGYSRWVRVARIKPQSLSYTVSGLQEREEYSFRVAAENVEGVSKPITIDGVVPRRPASEC